MQKRYYRELTAEQDALFRDMVNNNCSQMALTLEFQCGVDTVKRWLAERNMKLAPRPFGRPRKVAITIPPTRLEEIVDALRTRFCPVHAEDTARHPHQVPHRYTEHSRFRVGGMRNVSVEELVRL